MTEAFARLMARASLISIVILAACQIAQAEDLTAEQYYERGYKENEAGKFSEAQADFTAAIQKNPQYWKAYANRGASKYNCHDYHGALQDINIGIAHLPPLKSLTDLKAMTEKAIANESAQSNNLEARRQAAIRARQMLLNAQLGLDGDITSPAYQIARLAATVRARGGTIPRDLVKPMPNSLITPSGSSLLTPSGSLTSSNQTDAKVSASEHKRGAASTESSPFHVVAGGPLPESSSSTSTGDSPFASAGSTSSTKSSSVKTNSNLASKLESASPFASTSSAPPDAHMSAQEYFDRACGKSKEMDWAGAIKDYDECIRLDPKHGPAYANRGSARFNNGDRDGGLADFNKAVDLMPDNPGVKELRAQIVKAMEQIKKMSPN